MAGQTVDYIVRVRGATDASVNQAIGELQKFVNAQEGVAVSAEKMARAQISAEKALERHSRQLDIAFRHQREMERLQKDITRAREQGLNVDEQATRLTALLTERQQAASRAQRSLADTTKLSRYEMINLSRQIQDVGVGLTSGQSPFTVLVQQGTQIADIFAASQVTVRQFFSNAIGWAGRFAMSTAGVVTGITAIGAGALFAASSWSSGQREITRALSGIGAASGVTRDQINQIGEATSRTTAASANEAREAATTFAATGKIYGENIKAATELTMDFARATGVDMSAAAKALAEALADPAKGAQELNKQIGFLDARTLEYIQTLLAQNKLQEAQAVLLNSMRSQVQQQAQNIGFLEKAWQAATKAVSEYFEKAAARPTARTIERLIPGADLGGFTDQERLDRARSRRSEVAQSRFQGPLAQRGVIDFAVNELMKLEAAATNAAKAADDQRFQNLTLQAKAATEAMIPEINALRQLEEQLKKIADARSAAQQRGTDPISGGAVEGPGRANTQFEQAAVDIGKVRTEQLREQADQHGRAAAQLLAQAQLYPGLSLEVVKQLEAQKGQLAVAQAVTVPLQLEAQERARIAQLLDEGRTVVEATRIAEGERAITQAQINTEAQRNLMTMKEQEAVAGAITEQQRQQAQESATYNQLIRQGVDAELARSIAIQQTANAQAQLSAGLERTLQALKDQEEVARAVTMQERLQAQERARFNELARATNDTELSRKVATQERRNQETAINSNSDRNLATLRDQEAVQGAVTGLERIQAQETAKLNSLMREGVDHQKAQAEATQQTNNLLAGVNAGAEQQLRALQEQNLLINATSDAERARIESNIMLNRLLDQGVDAMLAQQIAAQQLKNTMDRAAQSSSRISSRTNEITGQTDFFNQYGKFIGTTSYFDSPGQFEGTKSTGTPGPFMMLEQFIREQEGRGAKVTPLSRGIHEVPIPEITETSESIRGLLDQALQQGKSLEQITNDLINNRLGGFTTPGDVLNDALQQLIQLQSGGDDPAREIELTKKQIELVSRQPRTLEQLQLLKQLNDQLKQLTESTDQLNDTMQIGLDPIYTQGHQALKIGYYDERGGGMRTGTGWASPSMSSGQRLPGVGPATTMPSQPPPAAPPPYMPPGPNPTWGLPYEEMMRRSGQTGHMYGGGIYRLALGGIMGPDGIMHYQYGGTHWGKERPEYRSGLSGKVTNTPSLFSTSENYHPEAIIPLQNGAVPVVLSGGSGGDTVQSRTTVVNVTVAGGTSMGDRRTRRQIAQGVGRAVAGAM